MKIKNVSSKKQGKSSTSNSTKESMFKNPPPRFESASNKSTNEVK